MFFKITSLKVSAVNYCLRGRRNGRWMASWTGLLILPVQGRLRPSSLTSSREGHWWLRGYKPVASVDVLQRVARNDCYYIQTTAIVIQLECVDHLAITKNAYVFLGLTPRANGLF